MFKRSGLKIKAFFKQNRVITILWIFLFAFPLVIGGVYALPLPQIIAVDSGNLLAYYGTAFGIFASFIIWHFEKKKQKKQRIKELKPVFLIKISLIDSVEELFTVDIINCSEHLLSYMYFYDEFVEERFKERYSFRTTYNKTVEQQERLKPRFNITVDADIIDSDGYPKYVQIMCNDRDGNFWNCCSRKVKDCEKIYYFPEDFEIIY